MVGSACLYIIEAFTEWEFCNGERKSEERIRRVCAFAQFLKYHLETGRADYFEWVLSAVDLHGPKEGYQVGNVVRVTMRDEDAR